VIVEEDVVDSHHAFLTQGNVARLRIPDMHLQTDPKMRVVVQIGTRRHNPIDEPAFNQRDER
jgi:hypothetical protein